MAPTHILDCRDALPHILRLVDDPTTAAALPAVCQAFKQAFSLREWLASQGHTLTALLRAVSQGRLEDVLQLLVAFPVEELQPPLTIDNCMEVLLGEALKGDHVDTSNQPGRRCDRCSMARFLMERMQHMLFAASHLQTAAEHGHAAVIPKLASECNGDAAPLSLGSALRALAGAESCTLGRFEAVEALLAAGALPTLLVPGVCACKQPAMLAAAGVDVQTCARLSGVGVGRSSRQVRGDGRHLMAMLRADVARHAEGSAAHSEAAARADEAEQRIAQLLQAVRAEERRRAVNNVLAWSRWVPSISFGFWMLSLLAQHMGWSDVIKTVADVCHLWVGYMVLLYLLLQYFGAF